MRLAWFSPFHNGCGPGFMSKAVVEHLKKYFDITVFYQWHQFNEPYEVEDIDVQLISDDVDLDDLARKFDFVVYNLGNNEENHYAIFNALKKVPGVVVLHDFVMQHAIVNDLFNRKLNPEIYYWLLSALYGTEGVRAAHMGYHAFSGSVRGAWDSPSVTSYPLYEIFAGIASGCVVHSRFFENSLKSVFSGPVLRTRNPYDLKRVPPQEVIDSFYRVRERAGGKVLFAAFGHMSPSKCIDRVIRVFAHSDRLKADARLVLCGGASSEYEKYLRRLCAVGGLQDCVEFRGSVSDSELYSLQVEADVFVNLRQPNTEGQSGSLIEQLAAGKPVICYDTGCFSDLPSGAAYKVSDPADFNELLSVFERALDQQSERLQIGKKGREYALEYDCARYAQEIFEFLFENREYLKAFQRRDFGAIRECMLNGRPANPDHPVLYMRTQAMWGVIDKLVPPESSQALSMIPEAAQGHYVSFLTRRHKPLVDNLLALGNYGDKSAKPDDLLAIGELSVFSTDSSPLLKRSFWEKLEGGETDRFVYICYKKLLCREPDAGGISGYCERIDKGKLTKKELILAMLNSPEFVQRFAEQCTGREYGELSQWAESGSW